MEKTKMLLNHRKELYQKAKEVFGESNQMNLLMEECGELVQATNKFMRKPHNKQIELNLAEEIADVEIMIEQIKTFKAFLVEDINRIKEEKLLRLRKRLQIEEEKQEPEPQEEHFYG